MAVEWNFNPVYGSCWIVIQIRAFRRVSFEIGCCGWLFGWHVIIPDDGWWLRNVPCLGQKWKAEKINLKKNKYQKKKNRYFPLSKHFYDVAHLLPLLSADVEWNDFEWPSAWNIQPNSIEIIDWSAPMCNQWLHLAAIDDLSSVDNGNRRREGSLPVKIQLDWESSTFLIINADGFLMADFLMADC